MAKTDVEAARRAFQGRLESSGKPLPQWAALATQHASREHSAVLATHDAVGTTEAAAVESVVKNAAHFASDVWTYHWVRRGGAWVEGDASRP